MLISLAVTTKLICVFVFAYAKSWFSHDEAHIKVGCKSHGHVILMVSSHLMVYIILLFCPAEAQLSLENSFIFCIIFFDLMSFKY